MLAKNHIVAQRSLAKLFQTWSSLLSKRISMQMSTRGLESPMLAKNHIVAQRSLSEPFPDLVIIVGQADFDVNLDKRLEIANVGQKSHRCSI